MNKKEIPKKKEKCHFYQQQFVSENPALFSVKTMISMGHFLSENWSECVLRYVSGIWHFLNLNLIVLFWCFCFYSFCWEKQNCQHFLWLLLSFKTTKFSRDNFCSKFFWIVTSSSLIWVYMKPTHCSPLPHKLFYVFVYKCHQFLSISYWSNSEYQSQTS